MSTTAALLILAASAVRWPLPPPSSPPTILGEPAPRWNVWRWRDQPEEFRLDVDAFRGKVVVLFLFQAGCSGCRKGGAPLLEAIRQTNRHADLRFVAIQSVIELGFANTFEAACEFADDFAFDFPVGHTGPELLRSYRGLLTPWFVIIDRRGVVRFSSFLLSPQRAQEILRELLAEPSEAPDGRVRRASIPHPPDTAW
ncbi:MAG: TlpA family protein disulfide reductase [Planctomycetes bacterium]|nr:TlpA family protein disulfide reductase [Planctomycetota bacterium]